MTGGGLHWRILPANEEAVRSLIQTLDVPESIARILVGRGFTEISSAEKFLRKSMSDLISPFELSGIQDAVKRIHHAITQKQSILVHGDYDADGITSAAILTMFLKEIGAMVTPFLPNRLTEGHGISEQAIQKALEEKFSVVITCDCGTSSVSEIRELAKDGIDTIVTDHHQPPKELPESAIVVNPKTSLEHPHEDLSGVGVAFLLVAALRSYLREIGFFADRAVPNLKRYLDIVALGTLADMAPLTEQNRILVSHGLDELTLSERPGIMAMKERAGIQISAAVRADDVGFRLAPRMNAAARLGHAGEVLELLLCTDPQRAAVLAGQLEEWNQERKNLQSHMLRIATLEADDQARQGKNVLVIFSPEFHPGIIGLVAQKLSETYALPAFVFTSQGEEWLQGSARSRSSVDIVRVLTACAPLLDRFGGHREAGGCRLRRPNFSQFKASIELAVAREADGAAREISIDAELSLGHVNDRFFSHLNRLRPFGIGNSEPVFCARVQVAGSPKEVGEDHVRVMLRGSGGPVFPAVGFGMWKSCGSLLRGEVKVAYSVDENDWKGRRELQIRLRDVKTV